MIGSRPLKVDEIATIYTILNDHTFLGDRNSLLFILGHRTGFRVSELLSIKVRHCFSHGKISDRVMVERKDMKGKMQSRSVILHSECKALLTLYVDKYKLTEEDYLFPSTKGEYALTRIQVWKILDKAFHQAKLDGKLGTHCMRKTFAQRVYHGLDKDMIGTQRALGHKNINSTGSYLSFEEEDIDAAILRE